MAEPEKIELHAIYAKDGQVLICDQHGRRFDAQHGTAIGRPDDRVLVEVELESPHWPMDSPRANIRISVPLEVEERLPDWMIEHLHG